MLDYNRLKIELQDQYISYSLDNNIYYKLYMFTDTEFYVVNHSVLEQQKIISIKVLYIDENNHHNNDSYSYNNCTDIPKSDISLIKELINIFYETYIIPELLTNNTIEDEYIYRDFKI